MKENLTRILILSSFVLSNPSNEYAYHKFSKHAINIHYFIFKLFSVLKLYTFRTINIKIDKKTCHKTVLIYFHYLVVLFTYIIYDPIFCIISQISF